LTPLLEVKLKEEDTAYWVEKLNARGIPSGDILGLEEALKAPQTAHRDTIVTVNEPGIGDIKIFNLTAKFSQTPGAVKTPPPRLSAHTAEILGGLGYTSEDLKNLKEKGAI
jgi:crotonobetainyl-CoA:carnitine CoA-transferase CaiB-like acyl-CoA transferase